MKNKILVLLIAFTVIYVPFALNTTIHVAQGQSSNPVINEGDKMYGFKPLGPKKGKMSMWKCAECNGAQIGKYTLATPGDHLEIKGEDVYVNGEKQTIEINGEKQTIKASGFDSFDGVMGEDEYFLIGLNPNHSTDSRQLGTFSEADHISRLLRIKKANSETVYAAEETIQTNGW